MAVIGIVVFCGALVGLFAWLLNRPERPKDPEEDREQEEYLTEWSRNHEKSTTTISMLNALVVAFRLRVMMPLKQEDPVQNISKQNGSSARSAELK